MVELRPYQKEAKAAIIKSWKEYQKSLLVLPTGTGKTIVFSKVAEDRTKDGRVLIMAHREELLQQAADKIWKSCGIPCSLEKAESSCLDSLEPVTVGSVQTLMSERRLSKFSHNYFQTIIVDEAHHALSDSYQRVLNHFPEAKILGVTATPDRGDKKNLGQFFENLAYEYSLLDAINDGYLCSIKAKTIPLQIDLNQVKISQGDYQAGDLGDALEPYLEQIADAMMEYRDRKTVVFLPLVATSQKFCQMLNNRGFRACEVNGNSPDRAQILQDYEDGKYNVICNSMLLTEGWDCPSVDCIVILRPTKVRSLYCQMVGRGTRLHPGKDHLLLLDFLWMCDRHELCRPAYLIAKNEKEAKAITDKITDSEDGLEIREAEELVEKDAAAEREAALARELEAQRRKKSKLINPLAVELLLDVGDYEPEFMWQMELPTDKQLKAIEGFGIDPSSIRDKGMASLYLDKCFKRREIGLASPKQVNQLNRYGFPHPEMWKKEDAAKVMGVLASNHWRLPGHLDPNTWCPKYIKELSVS